MTNAIDYIKWRGDLSFEASPVTELDLFIFSQLATPDYKNILDDSANGKDLVDTATEYFKTHSESVENLGVLQSDSVLPMLRMLANYPRFESLKLSRYRNIVDNEKALQFSAVTITAGSSTVVAIRGTDDSIVGWKEDFNLAIKDEVPAQSEAVKYLKEVLESTDGDIYVCGHSKGGNLAVYSAATLGTDPEVYGRIKEIVSFDGPGFNGKFLSSPQYEAVKDKLTTIISKNSLVGMIMDYAGELVITNTQTSGPMAHDGFKWEVLGTKFVRTKELSDRSKAFHNAIKDLFEKMPPEESEKAFEAMFGILMSTGADTITDLKSQKALDLTEILKNLNTNKEVSEFNIQLLRNIVKSYVDIELDELKEKVNGLGDKLQTVVNKDQ